MRFVLLVKIAVLFAASSLGGEHPRQPYPSFRVETDLYEGDATAPQSQHLILFDAGAVYDLPVGQGSVITVFDVPRNRIVLIHKVSRVRTSISTDTLIQMTAQLRAAAAGQATALGLNAKVIPGPLPDSYVVEFGSNRYEATGQPVTDAAIAAEFASFTAWASRLNIARHVGSPPFARITLADHLAAEKLLPRELKLDIKIGLKSRKYRSENLVVERLSDLDRKKINDVGGMIATFTEVEFAEFPAE